jgi:asparagine synthase (glutamine-hydrolysing)
VSAVAGIVRFDDRPVDRHSLERMLSALRPHGPDKSKIAIAGVAGLGHALMRMTPEDYFDGQPYEGSSGATITADLRLDNRSEMIERLRVAAEEAASWPDSRIVLQLWERWGDDIWPDLRGPFAAAIWDPRSQVLTLARDHLGLNVVMYHHSPRAFSFATMPKGLFALPWIERELNSSKLADFLVLNHADLATTFYKDVSRLLPGHVMKVSSDGAARRFRFWSPEPAKKLTLRNDDEYALALRECLGNAVKRQLRSSGSIGCHLTGGLDSSSVSVLAAATLARSGKTLHAFTHVPRPGFDGPSPPGWYSDEQPLVEEICRLAGNIVPTFVRSDQTDDFDELEKFFHFLESPVRNVLNLGWMMDVSRAARRQGCRVLLGGQFGNLTVSWSGWSQIAEHWRGGRFVTALRQLKQYYLQSPHSVGDVGRKLLWEPLAVQRHRCDPADAPWQDHSAINPGFAKSAEVWKNADAFGHDFSYRLRPGDRAHGLTNIDYLGDWLAAQKAATGVEYRDPTADIDVVSFCLSIPPEQFLAEGIDRSLIRRAMRPLLPEKVISSRKSGLQSADWHEKLGRRRDWMRGQIDEFARSPRTREFIDLDRLRGALSSWPETGWETRPVVQEYQLALARGIGAGQYLKWFERAN